ncbi:MAG: DUF3500 domain-containing protein [Bryobacterales bacterium]
MPVREMDAAQKEALLELTARYINLMDDGHAKVKMDEVRARLDDTYFAWIGESGPDSVFYYRIHSPVLLIELDHQNPAGLSNRLPWRAFRPSGSMSTPWSTPNGNDYGRICCGNTTSAATSQRSSRDGGGGRPYPASRARRGRRPSRLGCRSTSADRASRRWGMDAAVRQMCSQRRVRLPSELRSQKPACFTMSSLPFGSLTWQWRPVLSCEPDPNTVASFCAT